MNRKKILILVAMAATALMATVGAGAASATPTALCKAPTTFAGLPICEPGHIYPAGQNIHAILEPGTVVNIATPNGVVVCTFSTLDANTEKETEKPLGAFINVLIFGNCHNGEEEVEVVTLKPGTLDIEIIDLPFWTHDGTLTLTGTEITVLFKKTGAHCVYDAGHTGVLTGGPMATIDWTGTLTTTAGNAQCIKGNANWNGAYTVTTPEPLWISM
jgi:hypothetical protein